MASNRSEFIRQNFARVYIELINKIHDTGSGPNEKTNSVLGTDASLNDKIQNYVTKSEFLDVFGRLGFGNDSSDVCYFLQKIALIEPEVLKYISAMWGNLIDLKLTRRVPEASNSPGEVLFSASRYIIIPKYISVEVSYYTHLKDDLVETFTIPQKEALNEKAWSYLQDKKINGDIVYDIFAITCLSSDGGHVWAYVKSSKDGKWYRYDSLGKKAAKRIDNKQDLQLTKDRSENVQVAYYKLNSSCDSIKNALDEYADEIIKNMKTKRFIGLPISNKDLSGNPVNNHLNLGDVLKFITYTPPNYELYSKLSTLKQSLQSLKEKLSTLKSKLSALRAKLKK